MQNKINDILNKIREANQELMKLEMGCRIVLNRDGVGIFTIGGKSRKPPYDGYVISEYTEWIITEDEIVKILGKDPTLSDLFYTMKKREGYRGFEGLIREDDWGVGVGNYEVAKILKLYNYEKSLIQNLENEELVDFIYNIICKEE